MKTKLFKLRITLAMAIALSMATTLYAEEYVEGLTHWPVMTLRDALQRGLAKNLDLRVESINVPIGKENVTAEDARFDPIADASLSAQTQKTPSSSAFSGDDFTLQRSYDTEAGLSKKFSFGLDSRLSARTSRATNNSTIEGLDPQYRSFLVLDMTQPLLRDFGSGVNTTDLHIAENRLSQAGFGVLSRAERLAADIETAYYEMTQSIEIYTYRIESRDLARQLLDGNREKFEAGLIATTEVQEAETAVASRDELVLAARQQMEKTGNRLKDLLEINREDPLSREFFRTEPMPGIEQVFPTLDAALPLAFKNRPDLEQQRIEIASRNIRLEFAKNQTLPRLDLKATFGVNGLSGENRNINFAGITSSTNQQSGNYFDSVDRMAKGDGYEWFTGVQLTFPLGNREAKARYKRSDLEKSQAIYGLKRMETSVETDVIDGLISVNRSLERIKVAGRFESLAQTTLGQEMERLKEGFSDTFRILDFQDKVIDARIRKVNALGDFNKGLASLYRAMGTNLERLDIVYKVENQEIKNESL